MKLSLGKPGESYRVLCTQLPTETQKRLESLGMTKGTWIQVLNNKNKGTLIVKIRGTRFALGRNISQNIEVETACPREEDRRTADGK